MASQDDLGMLWYGVTGVSFNPADPADVMLNTGTAAPMLSDHPRHMVPTSYTEPMPPQPTQMLYDPTSGDYVTQPEYLYDTYDAYDDESSGQSGMGSQSTTNSSGQGEENTQPKSKKPKVHQNPALKLKTPIAYQRDTDISAIPITREGMAVCEKCGAIGVKHAFYGKDRKYCSLACARGPLLPQGQQDVNAQLQAQPPLAPSPERLEIKKTLPLKVVPPALAPAPSPTIKPQMQHTMTPPAPVTKLPAAPTEQVPSPTILPSAESSIDLSGTFDWSPYLQDENFVGAPVWCFKHAPMSECWEQMCPGMKVEVACKEEGVTKDSLWVATVIKIIGYKALLRFEGFIEDSSKDFWVDLCSEEVHPVGWCALQGRPLIPPRSIQHKYKDWKEFLMKRLTGARTLPTNFVSRVIESQKSRFRPGLNVEVVDKNRIAQMRVATVTEVVGKRLHLRYHGAPQDDNGFWCHEDAAIIHPVGWSREVGHEIVASQSYHEKCIQGTYEPNDAPPDLFTPTPTPAYGKNPKLKFVEGMKLEAIDPLNLATVCVATVMKVLRNHFLMIRIDSYESDDTGSDWFCYHSTSPCIFPAGFCEMNSIPLTPPRGYEGQFSWFKYLRATKAIAAPPALFNREVPQHGFKVHMHLESADLMDPRLVCVATIIQVKGRLLRLHFDGWENDFDQWVDCQSTDIYPVGWCQMAGYPLEGPKVTAPLAPISKKRMKGGRVGKSKRGRGALKRGGGVGGGSGGVGVGGGRSDLSEGGSTMVVSAGGSGGRRGRPPKDRGHTYNQHAEKEVPTYQAGGQLDSHSEGDYFTDNTNAILENNQSFNRQRGRRGRPPKDVRRSPRAGMAPTPNPPPKVLPNRITRARLNVDMNSDEEEMSDETSSGVASLAESENSGEAWEMEDSHMDSHSPPLLEAESAPHVPDSTQGHESVQEDSSSSSEGQEKEMAASEHSQVLLPPQSIPPPLPPPPPLPLITPAVTTIDSQTDSSTTTTSITLPTTSATVKGDPTIAAAKNGLFMQSKSTAAPVETLPPNNPPSLVVSTPQTCTTATTFENISPKKTMQDETPVLEPVPEVVRPYIPRLLDGGALKDGAKVKPKTWTPEDVADFLRKNDCASYCDTFISKNIDGTQLLALTQNEVLTLTGMKVGPSLKIYNFVQQLHAIINPAQARYQATLLKRGLAFS